MLTDLKPILKKDPTKSRPIMVPDFHYVENIKVLRQILDLIKNDWSDKKKELQTEIRTANNKDQKLLIFLKYFSKEQTFYIKTLFSYIFFFWSIKNVYDRFYEELNKYNKQIGLNVKHSKPPKLDNYLEKLRMIRNLSIAHIGSKEADPLDSIAAQLWSPMSATFQKDEDPSMEHFEFLSMKIKGTDKDGNKVKARDFEIKGLEQVYNKCEDYIEKYDRICEHYLLEMKSEMPINKDGIEYSN